MRTAAQRDIEGGLSTILKHVLYVLFSPNGFNLSVGMRLQDDANNDFYLRLEMGPFIQDLKAHQHTNDTKGCGGTKCCHKCKAVLNIDPELIKDHPYWQHYSTASPDKWDPHSPESYWEMVDTLKQAHGHVSKTRFALLQQAYGVHYNKEGLVWDKYLRRHYSPVTHAFEDPMHCLYTSGGVAQYEVNAFVLAIQALEGIGSQTVKALDAFQQEIRWADHKRLCKDFFQTRVQKDPTGHVKCFAVECMAAVTVLGLFCDMVLKPARLLPEHCRCMDLLCQITCLFQTGDKLVPHTRTLRALVHDHHQLFIRVYGVQLAKPKLHCLNHIPDNIDRFARNLDCKPMEWKHSSVKRMSQGITNQERGVNSCLKRMLFEMLLDMDELDFVPNCLRSPRPAAAELRTCLLPLMPDIGHIVKASTRGMHTEAGEVFVNALVQLSTRDGHTAVGKARLFASGCAMHSGMTRCFIIFEAYKPAGPTQWAPCGTLAIAAAEDIVRTLSYAVVGDKVQPVFPKHDLY